MNRKERKRRINARIKTLKEFRDIGETFHYLGRLCVCLGHSMFYPHAGGTIPMFCFEYADDHGIIHSHSLDFNELPAVEKENEQKVS